jgi:hypothetical protein
MGDVWSCSNPIRCYHRLGAQNGAFRPVYPKHEPAYRIIVLMSSSGHLARFAGTRAPNHYQLKDAQIHNLGSRNVGSGALRTSKSLSTVVTT